MPKYAPLEPGDPPSLGSYEVVGRLGAGGQGAVFLGRAAGGEYVAIKLLHSQMNTDPQARARFVREVAAAQKVEPFCTARVIEAEINGDRPYVVSEYIDGPSLHELVATQGPRPAQELSSLAIGMLTALAAIHEVGIVHRDFKPNNVLLAEDGPRVVDFGIARTVNSQESAVTATGMVVGTPGYLAPEQLTGSPLQPAVDIFAFGATMVFAATGQSPFEAETLPVIINRILNDDPDLSGLPEGLRGLISRCLAKDAAQRPQAIEALVELIPQAGAAPVSPAAPREELLNQGTRIAAQLAPPPPPRTPTPQPFTPPAAALGQQPYSTSGAGGQQPFAPPGPASPPQFAPPTPPPYQQPGYQPQGFQQPPPPQQGQPQHTPPPFQQSGFQQPNFQPPPYQQTPPPFQGGPGTPPPFQGGPGTPPPFPGGPAYPMGQPPAKSNTGLIVGLAAAAVVLVVILVAVIAVAAGDDKDDPPPLVQPTNTQTPFVPPQTTTLPQPSSPPDTNTGSEPSDADTTFIGDYAGTWRGTVYQKKPTSNKYVVTVTIAEGSATGQIKYENDPSATTTWSCSGTVTFLHHNPGALYKTVVKENITVKNNAKCDTYSYDVLFPKSDGTGMFITNYFTETAADTDKDYSAIGTLDKQ